MKVCVGIDLGSTTTKAVILDPNAQLVGRGITNSRSNYDVACRVAREEAFVQTRFTLTRAALAQDATLAAFEKQFLPALTRNFRLQQHLEQLQRLREALHRAAEAPRHEACRGDLAARVATHAVGHDPEPGPVAGRHRHAAGVLVARALPAHVALLAPLDLERRAAHDTRSTRARGSAGSDRKQRLSPVGVA